MDASATSSAVSTLVLFHITLPRSVRAAHYPQPPLKVSVYFLYAVGSRVRAQREFYFMDYFPPHDALLFICALRAGET